MNGWSRREVLKAGLAGASALCPWSGVFGQSAGSVLRAPKQALVVGNGRYRQAPLKNPVNDAKALGAVLKSLGFDVTLALELTHAGLSDAISAYSKRLVAAKAVGLFYFAGHGVQLAWRNYLIPVDARISDIQQLRERAIDVNTLIQGIRDAGNPMNIVILDACRDNPFGEDARAEQRGLSQLDAPPGTMLAYATAPGNVAVDGEGAHGLYTEHLLREIAVPEAKVEDVFKRVRLAVRRRSNGQQIPWESTSLEEDFWFIPPRDIKAKLAQEEADRLYKQELAAWERAKDAAEPGPVEEYLRRYPSGRFSELAQLRLDNTLATQGERRIEVVAAPENPYTKGVARTDTKYRVGDRYMYREIDLLTQVEQRQVTFRVSHVTDSEVIFNRGATVTDHLGNYRLWGRSIWSANQTVPTEFVVGKRWDTRFDHVTPEDRHSVVTLELKVADREKVTVPAGTFNAFRVDATGWRVASDRSILWNWKTWFVPDQVRRPVAWEWFNRNNRGRVTNSRRLELTEFQQS